MVFSGGSNAAKQAYDWAEEELADFEAIAAERSKEAERRADTSKAASDSKPLGANVSARRR